jgi:hypothetical protein
VAYDASKIRAPEVNYIRLRCRESIRSGLHTLSRASKKFDGPGRGLYAGVKLHQSSHLKTRAQRQDYMSAIPVKKCVQGTESHARSPYGKTSLIMIMTEWPAATISSGREVVERRTRGVRQGVSMPEVLIRPAEPKKKKKRGPVTQWHRLSLV